MNGADLLCDTLLANGIDTCFVNPGTSEMHFVAALDRKPQMRCVLGLFEGVATGAADGYARMKDHPAATLLHLGPGLANGLANLHNTRRAHTPVVNIVGDHATYHLQHDAPLTSDIESLARPMSCWVGRADQAAKVGSFTEEAIAASVAGRGVATMILPADAAWTDIDYDAPVAINLPRPPLADADLIRAAGKALKSGRRAVIILAGKALRAEASKAAGQIAAACGAVLMSQTSDRTERGTGRAPARPVPYPVDVAVKTLQDFELAICVGGKQPVGFFAYPGKPSTMLPPNCEVIQLAEHEHDIAGTLRALADELGLKESAPFASVPFNQHEIVEPTGALSVETIALAVARRLPENAIICEESITSGGRLAALAPGLHPHDHLPLTGGAIGEGIPLAVGAGVACPDRKIVAMQADGSGMYTIQGLWTQAREKLDVLTVVYSNRAYAILQGEMRNVGVKDFGVNARRMLNLDDPALDWCLMAQGMGVEAGRATTVEEFCRLLDYAMPRKGPFLIEAVI